LASRCATSVLLGPPTPLALARKLLIAMWRLVTTGEIPDGVRMRSVVA
jgi:hypothetical protein